jgi:NADPH:quinone reductase-like Zn-dependent oxidoreductase
VRFSQQQLNSPLVRPMKRILKWIAATIFLALILSIFAGFIAYWRSTSECDRKTVPSNPMKAIVQCEYGSPDLLKFEDVEKPVPNDNQVLIKIRAASLNFIDAGLMRSPFLLRLMTGGLRKPKKTELGSDVAGQVEAIGKNVTQFKPGDEVFGLARPSLAEYVCARERALVIKPANVTFEEAGSVGLAGLTALQGLRTGKIQPGQKVLINGASGGVGTFAVQIAKSFGTEVTAVCSTSKVDLVRSIGADYVIDYTKEDFTKSEQRYDVIYDNVGNRSRAERSRILTPNGICVLAGIGGAGPHEGQLSRIGGGYKAFLASRFSRQKFQMYRTTTKQEDLAVLRDLMATGKVTPVIDRTYKLGETAEAMRYLEQGHARGKVVITVEQDEQASLSR